MKSNEVEYWKSLYEIQKGVCSTLNLERILDMVTSSAVDKMGFKASSIRLFDRDKKRLELLAVKGLSKEYLGKGPVELQKSPVDQKCLEGENVIVENVSGNGRTLQYPDEAIKEGIVSMLCSPLTIRGKTIGVMRVYTDKPHRFTSEEIEFISALSGLGAMAIENARLYSLALENLQDLTKELWEKSEVWGKTKKI